MTYRITYNVILFDEVLYGKEIKVKNKSSEIVAKVSLEDYLKRKHGDNFRQLVIIKCSEDNPFDSDILNSIFGGFK